jgi:hypothetical protein
MLTKIITAALALMVALMVLRYLSERAHRAQLHERVKSRRRAEAPVDPGPHVRPDVPLDGQPEPKPKPEDKPAKPGAVTTLEVDPDTGVYRPKG